MQAQAGRPARNCRHAEGEAARHRGVQVAAPQNHIPQTPAFHSARGSPRVAREQPPAPGPETPRRPAGTAKPAAAMKRRRPRGCPPRRRTCSEEVKNRSGPMPSCVNKDSGAAFGLVPGAGSRPSVQGAPTTSASPPVTRRKRREPHCFQVVRRKRGEARVARVIGHGGEQRAVVIEMVTSEAGGAYKAYWRKEYKFIKSKGKRPCHSAGTVGLGTHPRHNQVHHRVDQQCGEGPGEAT